MPTLIYSMSVSLDGHVAGPDGAIDWAAPDEELMRFHNEQTRELTGHLSGRGLYEDMLGWETAEQTRTDPREIEFARLWKAIPKVVFSTSLTTVEGNARLARGDLANEVAELKNQPGGGTVSVGGAGLAACLAGKDLIDEYRLFVSPVVLGGGIPYFSPLPKRLDLELIETRTFSQVVYLRYRRSSPRSTPRKAAGSVRGSMQVMMPCSGPAA
jgi:dihydrofolate reductase